MAICGVKPAQLPQSEDSMRQPMPVWQSIIVGLLCACATQRPRTETPISTNPNPLLSRDSVHTSKVDNVSIYQPGNARYTLQLKSVVQTTMGDSIPRVDSSRVTAVLSARYSLVPQSRFVRGVMMTDSVTLWTFTSIGTPAVVLPNQSYSMDIDPLAGKIVVGHIVQACTQQNDDGLFRGDEITPSIPSSGVQLWADSSTYSVCRGGVLFRFARVASYRRDTVSVPQAGDSLARVFRAVDLVAVGTGSQWQQAIEATGHGTSVDTLIIHTKRMQLQSISGTGRLELSFKSALRLQHFVQTTTTRITAQPTVR
jgi:hypothetical protein